MQEDACDGRWPDLGYCSSLMGFREFFKLSVLGLALGWLAAHGQASEPGLTFERDIRPILKANCFDCHGEGEKLEGGLDLRLRRLMVGGGESGPALVPGAPNQSLLVEKIRAGEMPKRERKLSVDEIERIVRWVETGAATARAEPDHLEPGIHITEEERGHWAFQPVRRPAVPASAANDRVRTAIDAFLVQALRGKGLRFGPEADKRTLIRRVYLGLVGFPPSPDEVAEFLEDDAVDAYERLVDRLIASAHYGERWARHWLDVAGYADSEGYSEADTERAYAWKYRDYVIESLNADKPLDRFITEQLAGDELVLAEQPDLRSALSDPKSKERLIATGYLRMCADGTGASGVDQETARNAVVTDTIKIVSTSLLGLSVGCAQCHDHRYEPIPQTDYYRLRALFEPAYDWKKWRQPPARLISLYTDAERTESAAVEKEARELGEERQSKQTQFLAAALEEHLKKFEETLRGPLREAYQTPSDKRTAEQKRLLDEHPSVNIHPGVLYQYNPKAAEELKAMDARINEVRARKPVEDFIRALTEEPGHLPVTYRFHRGDPKQPREEVAPGGLTVLGLDGAAELFAANDSALPTSGRRLAFARWLTGGEHPLVGRVLVNRVWLHHLGQGLVTTPGDFGVQGARPTHPELLDWLASNFTTPEGSGGLGWSMKRLHRLIVLSTVYRQSSARSPGGDAADPDNTLYWRKPMLRLEAETVRDAILAVSGALHAKAGGPPVPVREDATGQIVVGVDKKEGDNKMPVDVAMGAEEFRRSVYVQARRSRPLAFLNAFDAPVMEVNCERRVISTAAPQALMLMNSGFILQQAGLFAQRVEREAGADPAAQVRHAWQLAFSRAPNASEQSRALEFVRHQTLELNAAGAPEKGPAPATQALTNLCQALLAANEFLYVD